MNNHINITKRGRFYIIIKRKGCVHSICIIKIWPYLAYHYGPLLFFFFFWGKRSDFISREQKRQEGKPRQGHKSQVADNELMPTRRIKVQLKAVKDGIKIKQAEMIWPKEWSLSPCWSLSALMTCKQSPSRWRWVQPCRLPNCRAKRAAQASATTGEGDPRNLRIDHPTETPLKSRPTAAIWYSPELRIAASKFTFKNGRQCPRRLIWSQKRRSNNVLSISPSSHDNNTFENAICFKWWLLLRGEFDGQSYPESSGSRLWS